MKKIFTLIQGPPTHVKEITEHYKSVASSEEHNVVWVTQSSQDAEKLREIEQSSIKLLTYEDIEYYGFGNINLQVKSTSVGLDYCSENGASHVLKIRSDLIFEDHSRFTEAMNVNDRLQFYFYVKHNPNSFFRSLDTSSSIQWLEKEGFTENVKDVGNCDYVCDYVNFGPLEEMKDFWQIPLENEWVPAPAEFKLMHRYLNKKFKEPYEISYEFLSENIFDFFLSKAAESNPLFSLKNNYSSVDLFNTPDTIRDGEKVIQGYAG
jgi:hypothetical protein